MYSGSGSAKYTRHQGIASTLIIIRVGLGISSETVPTTQVKFWSQSKDTIGGTWRDDRPFDSSIVA